ncbi:hypothetical protein [Lysinibacillus fusiformis]|uniref:hypothetical protein n=1 Tax=Lysinibacillus fusiformis TaxID=28031 RepID=UPI00263B480F|nr:hypothetical protein [Lysinibacillus fusiformis]MDC6268004.1 hypothetical protein [Lysinibacillus sphaericus]MDN4967506.1 hypothetical protein [Lysinibacillus fusiformis]
MMIVQAYDVNPNKLMDELLSHNIKSTITSDLKENEYIAKNVTIRIDDSTDLDLVKHIISVHVPTTSPKPTEMDYLLDLDFRLSKLELNL